MSEDPGDLDAPVGKIRSHPGVVSDAVAAARRAYPAWKDMSGEDRLDFLRRYQTALRIRQAEIAQVMSRETGKPLAESKAEVQAMVEKVDVTAAEGLALVAERRFNLNPTSRAALHYRPLGLAAVIGPFNVPGHLPNGQIVPALLLGNTVVFKPSELTPFTGQLMAECFQTANLPEGVFNLVQGDGAVGARLAGHPDVNLVFFTGSVATGRALHSLCAGQPEKLLALEMGGKNAALVLDDAPLDAAAAEIMHGAFSTSGQRCSSTSRVFLSRSVADNFLKIFLGKVDALQAGYFTDEPSFGPLARAAAVENFLKAQKTAARLGYETLREGRRLSTQRRGHYVSPSVHLWKKPWRSPAKPAYWDEELFAPDVAIYLMGSDAEMAAANNASRFGLAASVFTKSEARFNALRGLLENGVVHWNRSTAMTPGRLPFGGLKASGNMRPAGLFVSLACAAPVASVEVPGA